MSAPSYDRRLTPARADLAAEHLRGLVDAPRYVEGRRCAIIAASAPLRRSPQADAPLETEALYGESVTVYDEQAGWAWAQLDRDQYVGYLPSAALGAPSEPTHRVAALRTHAYPGPAIKLPPRMALSLGSQLEDRGPSRATSRSRRTGFTSGHAIWRNWARASRTLSRSPSFFSRRPISGAAGRRRASTARGSSRRR